MKIAFIYTLAHPKTLAIRYVGKTKNKKLRWQDHVKGSGRNTSPKCLWVKELKLAGLKPVMEIIQVVEYEYDSAWQAAEIEQIKIHKENGCDLLNCDKGGGSGFDHKPETIEKIRIKAIARMDNSERAYLSKKCSGWKHTDEAKKAISDSQTGVPKLESVVIARDAGRARWKVDNDIRTTRLCVVCKGVIKYNVLKNGIRVPDLHFFMEGVGYIHNKCKKLL